MNIIDKDNTLEQIVSEFIKKGGRVNSYYLKHPRCSPTLVFFKRWYRGKTIKDAIHRALADLAIEE